jgi:hypothetical protein
MRHVTFSKVAFTEDELVKGLHSVVDPERSDILAYFKFDRVSGFYETYTYNASRNYSWGNLVLGYQSEPEPVCYCTPKEAKGVLVLS